MKNMSKAKRRWAAGIYVFMMIVTIVAAILGCPGILLLLFVFLQWCALIWYIASYIPYGQRILKSVLSKTLGIDAAF